MWSPYQCRCCGTVVTNHRNRRVLHCYADGNEGSSIYGYMLRLVSTGNLSARNRERFGELDISVKGLDKVYICKACFVAVDKAMKLNEQLRNLTVTVQTAENVILSMLTNLYVGGDETLSIEDPHANSPCTSTSVPRLLYPLLHEKTKKKSPDVVVTVKYRKERSYSLKGTPQRVTKSIVRGNRQSALKQLLGTCSMQKFAAHYISKFIQKELKFMCSNQLKSMLRDHSKLALANFSWDSILLELEKRCPLLFTVLRNCIPISSNHLLCVIFSILLKGCNSHVNLMQFIVSILMYTGHTGKLAFTRLNKLGLCMSRQSTVTLLDDIGYEHDELVIQWRNFLFSRINVQAAQYAKTHWIQQICEDDDETSSESCMEIPSPVTSPSPPPFSPLLLNCGEYDTEETVSCSTDHQSSIDSEDEHVNADQMPGHVSEIDETFDDSTEVQSPNIMEVKECSQSVDWKGFKIVGDNLDKNYKPRHQTLTHQNQSMHFFQSFAVMDRVNLSEYSDIPPVQHISEQIIKSTFIPSDDEQIILRSHFVVLIARVLVECIPCFAKFKDIVPKHITHQHYSEMCTKSKVVPLGVLLKNENFLDEMSDILDHHSTYVPMKEIVEEQDGDHLKMHYFHHILFGGDQVTASRTRSAKRMRQNAELGKAKLQGFIPIIEDWHAKVVLLEVIWSRLYTKSTSMEKGTLLQLKNLIHRTSVPRVPKNNVHAAEDFLNVVLKSHIIVAAMKHFRLCTLQDCPDQTFIPEDILLHTDEEKWQILSSEIEGIIDKHVDFSLLSTNKTSNIDGVLNYARHVLSLGLLHAEFDDAIHEGDGVRVLQCWKIFLPLFKCANRKNYAIESLNLLWQFHIALSPRQAMQLMWSRFINTQGKPGCNLPCDLHMEHLNKACKSAISSLGANPTKESISRVGKCIGPLVAITSHFDSESNIVNLHGKHSEAATQKDIEVIVKALLHEDVFGQNDDRKHKSFQKLPTSVYMNMTPEALLVYIKSQLGISS